MYTLNFAIFASPQNQNTLEEEMMKKPAGVHLKQWNSNFILILNIWALEAGEFYEISFGILLQLPFI